MSDPLFDKWTQLSIIFLIKIRKCLQHLCEMLKILEIILDLFVKMMRRFIFPGKIIKVILDYKENS